ncbi:hypothetical protein STCU_00621 [Strigomonas culicis]|nr:hypothetical protein STCU_00621 [Strigomonas culicis]|eukprot:EPY36367.1 hypothetical protein STCU_00621 [Strigomonas culicis]
MHYKASKRLQQFVSEERARWQKKVEAERAQKQKAKEAAAAAAAAGGEAAAPAATPQDNYDSDLQFRDLLAIKFAHPRFSGRHLRLSPLATFVYKCLYFYLWAVLVSLIVQGYLWFRNWVNPPARAGLRNIEEEVLHIPRLLFAAVVYGVARLVQMAQPVIDPIVAELTKLFPQANFDKYTSENLADRAKHLADDAHPSAEKRKEEIRVSQQKNEAERKTWWTRALIALLAVFSILCIL